ATSMPNRLLREAGTREAGTREVGRGGSKDPPLVAIDSTGLYYSHDSRYFERRARRERRAYQKWAAALWTGPQRVVRLLGLEAGPARGLPRPPATGGGLGGSRAGVHRARRRGLRLRGEPRLLPGATRSPRLDPGQDAAVGGRSTPSLPGRDGRGARV